MIDKSRNKVTPKTLPPNRLQLAEYKRNIHRAIVDVDVTIDDMLQQEFWTHAGKTLRNGDKIEILAADGKFYTELLVVSAQENRAIVKTIVYVELDATEKMPPKPVKEVPKYKTEYKGSNNKHCVIRTSDKTVIKEGFNSKAEAESWLNEYELGIAE